MVAPQFAAAAAAAASARRRSSRFAARALLACGAGLALLWAGSSGFVGGQHGLISGPREVNVAMGDIIKRTEGIKRRKYRHNEVAKHTRTLPNGQVVSQRRFDTLGPEEGDKPFPAGEKLGKELTVEFEEHPWGILRWQAGKGGNGAMVMQLGKPLFVNDPYATAANAGVKVGMVLKAVDGKDVAKENFDVIMNMINEPALRTKVPKPFTKVPPVKVTFAEVNA